MTYRSYIACWLPDMTSWFLEPIYLADVIVPNPVTLVPYRTFLEVEQPPSEFVFRIRDINSEPAFKIVEAEGGLWKHEAMASVKSYLEKELQNLPEREKITIIA